MAKKILSLIIALSLSFTIFIPIVETHAKGASGATFSARSFSTSSSSRSKTKPTYAPSKQEAKTKPADTPSKQEDVSNRKYVGMTKKGNFVKPTNLSPSKVTYYENKSYYNSSSGFATGLLVAGGTMLVLDYLTDDGDPVYVNADTGQTEDPDKYGENAQPITENREQPQENNDSKFVFAGFISVILILLIAIFVALKK